MNRRFVLERFGGPVHYVRNHCTECVVSNIQQIRDELQKNSSRPELLEYLGVNTAFVKAMSDKNTDNFIYLNEHVWRIVQTHSQTKLGNIVETGEQRPRYRLPLKEGDIRLHVFPDDRTRALASNDPRLDEFFQGPKPASPALLTVEEYAQF